MGDSGKLRVAMLPFGGQMNPYQALTRKALQRQGVNVIAISYLRAFPILAAIRAEAKILHFDWLHRFYIGRNQWRSVAKRMLFFMQLALVGDRKLVWTVHNLGTHGVEEAADGPARFLVRRSAALISLHKEGVSAIRERWPEAHQKPVVVIPHGHYADWYRSWGDREGVREQLGLHPDARCALFFGGIKRYKGLDQLILAFRDVGGRHDRLIIAGRARDKTFVKELSRLQGDDPRILMRLEEVPREEVAGLFAAADFTVLPFKEIFNSGSIILALSMGRAVVAPRLGAIPEIVPESALFVYDGGEKGLREALSKALHCDNLQRRGNVARQKVLRDHDWTIVGERLVALYRSIL